MDGWMDGWVDGGMGVKVILRITYNYTKVSTNSFYFDM
jgi:hypothetical protein